MKNVSHGNTYWKTRATTLRKNLANHLLVKGANNKQLPHNNSELYDYS